ncbi:MAG: amino acid adenylation domain-containing protein [Calditrichaeota bacterium]|nr:amino acid adenylation domain-containing protein [Calditrichota bacterium]
MDEVLKKWAELPPQKRQVLKMMLKEEGIDFLSIPIVRHPRNQESYPLSFGQQRLWFLEQFEPGSPLYNIPFAIRLKGKLDVAALEQSLRELVRRHEILRTVFRSEQGEPRQVIREQLDVPLKQFDLSGLSPADQAQEVQRLARQWARQPFDLENGPLFRYQLLRLKEDEHVFLLTMHHIISDGWSTGVLVAEVAQLYTAFRQGQPSPLPELPVQYVDYAIWQREWMDESGLEDHLKFWKQELAGIPDLLELPTDRPRPRVQTYNGATFKFQIPEDLSRQLRQLCKQEDVTLFMLMLAAFQTLLFRYSGQEDLTVGTPVANRNHSEIEHLIGFFVNTLVLRGNFEDRPTFREYLKRLKARTLDAFAHQDMPFEKLVEVLQPSRDMSHTPLFQTMFVLHNTPLQPLQLPDLTIEVLDLDTGMAKFDLILNVFEAGTHLDGFIEYNTDLFTEGTIQRMVNHYLTLLQGIVQNPDRSVVDIPMLPPEERQALVGELAGTIQQETPKTTVLERIAHHAKKTPDATAVRIGEEQLTYAGLERASSQLAQYLHQRGVGHGAFVGLGVDRSLDMVVGLLAIWKVGAVYVPLDPDYPLERLEYIAQDAGLACILTHARLKELFGNIPVEKIVLDEERQQISQMSAESVGRPAQPEDPAYVIYTSGSTGLPKGVVVRHAALAEHIIQMASIYQVTPEDRYLAFAAMNFDAALEQTLTPLVAGATLVLRDGDIWLPADFHQKVKHYQLTVINPPTVYWEELAYEWSQHPDRAADLPIRLVIAGGDAMHLEAVRRWHQTPLKGVRLLNAYGPTEATITTSLYEVPQDYETSVGLPVVPIGQPLANRKYYILDENDQPVPIGVPGELVIGGHMLADGYLHRPELTARHFVPDPFAGDPGARMYRTGDRVRRRPDGQLEFLGRVDTQVKIRGFRIELGEIETVLNGHEQIQQAVVTVREEAGGQKRLVAYFKPKKKAQVSINALRTYLRQRLPEYMIPALFMEVEAFPKTPSGKIDRRALPEPEGVRPELSSRYVAPRTPIEQELAQIAAEVLGLDRVGVQDNFFELGGHSMLAVKVIARIQEKYQVNLPLRTLFESPTVEGLAMAITQLQAQQQDDEQLEQLLDELENLSDEEARKLLNE